MPNDPIQSQPLNETQIKELAVAATANVFHTMLSMEVKPSDEPAAAAVSGARVVASLGFAGENVSGGIYIEFGEAFARAMAVLALRLEPNAEVTASDVNDVVGELCNMIGGTISSRLTDLGFRSRPTVPFITRGTNFEIELAGGVLPRRFVFACQQNRFVVGLCMRTMK